MQDHPIVLGFSAGELSPWLSTRVDLAQYSRGAALLENFLVEPYGGIRRRNGTKFIKMAAVNEDAIRLYPFTYSSDVNIMLEFYPSGIRFYMDAELLCDDDGEVYTVVTPWDTAEKVNSLRMVQVNDVIFVTCPSCTPYKICRYGNVSWKCTKMEFDPYPRQTYLTQEGRLLLMCNSTSMDSYTIVSADEAGVFSSAMLNTEYLLVDCKLDERTYWTEDTISLTGYSLYYNMSAAIPKGAVLCLRDNSTAQYEFYYCLQPWFPSSGYDSSSLCPEQFPTYFFKGVPIMTNSKPYYVTGDWELRTFGEWNSHWDLRVSYDDYSVSSSIYDWDWVTMHQFYQNSDETRQNWAFSGSETTPCRMLLVLRSASATSFSSPLSLLIKQHDREILMQIDNVSSSALVYATVLSETSGLPYEFMTRKWSFGAIGVANGYPEFVGVNQGRLWLGGMSGSPTTLIASKVDDYENFQITSEDDSSLQLTLASDDQSRICWLSTTKGLLLGTSEGEWVLDSQDGSGLTAYNASFTRQSSVGSADNEAHSVENSVFYVQRGGKRLREISYKLESDGYTSTDTSLLAEHLFTSGVNEWTVQRGGSTHVWVLMNDGSVAVLTTNISQQVTAWQRVSFEGARVLHIAVLPNPESLDDDVWFVLERESGICIEYICGDEIYLDSHCTLSCEAGSLSVPQLAGQSVACYLDNGSREMVETEVADDGSISVPDGEDGATYTVGLTVQSLLQTMPLESEMSFNAVSQLGRIKLRLLDSDPSFYYKASHVDSWEFYDASRDCREYPYSGSVRLSQIPSPGVGQGISLSYAGPYSFNLLAMGVERDYHGK